LRWFPGNRFICVLDKEDWNPMALEIACSWARMETIRASTLTPKGAIDIEHIQARIDEAARHLLDLERLRAKLGVSKAALRDSEVIITELESKLVSCLASVSKMLTAPGG
jgi:hypothetical protein